MNEVFSAGRDATITAYNKYRTFYDRKANAAPLSKHRYCLLLNPKLANVNDHMGKSLTKWIPFYRVEQRLTNPNYIVRKVGTNYTQCVHRIRLRPITPQYQTEDLAHIPKTLSLTRRLNIRQNHPFLIVHYLIFFLISLLCLLTK